MTNSARLGHARVALASLAPRQRAHRPRQSRPRNAPLHALDPQPDSPHSQASPGGADDAPSTRAEGRDVDPHAVRAHFSEPTQAATGSAPRDVPSTVPDGPPAVVTDSLTDGADSGDLDKKEMRVLISTALPISLSNILGFSQSTICAAFLGHLGTQYLSSSVLASSFYNITGLSVVYGLAAGMETLCGQVRQPAAATPGMPSGSGT